MKTQTKQSPAATLYFTPRSKQTKNLKKKNAVIILDGNKVIRNKYTAAFAMNNNQLMRLVKSGDFAMYKTN